MTQRIAMRLANTAGKRTSDLMLLLIEVGLSPDAMSRVSELVREITEAARLSGIAEATARVTGLFDFETNGRPELHEP